ncbi:MAG: phosphonate C-P lyase system protein PhnH [Caldilineaceae bacterium]
MNTSIPTATIQPRPTHAESEARITFQTLMFALSNPGRIFTLAGSTFTTVQSCLQIGRSLLDLETSFYSPNLDLIHALKSTGSPFRTASSADYLFFPVPDVFEAAMLRVTLDSLDQIKTGTLTYPDQSATLIVACLLGHGRKLGLNGPGIQDRVELIVDELPLEFWQLRNRKMNYPLGHQ